MKPEQVNKLYNKLTPQEQAALCFDAAIRQDKNELDSIVASIEQHTYKCLDYRYRKRVMGLYMLGLFYGGMYWKTRTLMTAAAFVPDCQQEAHLFLNKLSSMDVALIAVCEQIKVDIIAVRTLAGCIGEPTFNQWAEPEQVAEYTEILLSVVD
ncbi:MAG: hypothetical protein Q8L79_18460 [Methylobacter sp.]|uniref:hypothetical protein n=1 Tax=Methylobacter sp. TaxID=2051955 RepID=UPI0027310EC2|nr:hypothetical protein [Methylobacter sp.]MDP1667092.1 hypothetical protein [Methylobacter sp.]